MHERMPVNPRPIRLIPPNPISEEEIMNEVMLHCFIWSVYPVSIIIITNLSVTQFFSTSHSVTLFIRVPFPLIISEDFVINCFHKTEGQQKKMFRQVSVVKIQMVFMLNIGVSV